MGAIELVKDKATRERYDTESTAGSICRDTSLSNDLVMRATGDIMLLAPPLIITKEQADEIFTKARKTLDETYQKLQDKFA